MFTYSKQSLRDEGEIKEQELNLTHPSLRLKQHGQVVWTFPNWAINDKFKIKTLNKSAHQ